MMTKAKAGLAAALLALAVPASAAAQQAGDGPSVADAAAGGRELVLRAPDASVDQLFRVVHASMQAPDEARALCALFEPGADRSVAGINTAVACLSAQSRERFAFALIALLLSAADAPPQPYDEAAAQQWLRQASVRAAMLDERFADNLAGTDPDARCRALRMLLDVLAERPLAERAAVTRRLLHIGLARMLPPQ
jgi:hypothetical protein